MSSLTTLMNNTVQSDSAVVDIATEQAVAGENIFIVMAVTLIIWLGILGYLFFVDQRIKKLNDRLAD